MITVVPCSCFSEKGRKRFRTLKDQVVEVGDEKDESCALLGGPGRDEVRFRSFIPLG
jgi:hypothetical protein